MARPSAASRAVVIAGNFGERPDPPDDMPEVQQRIWRETVGSESADFFRTSALRELLRDYCRHKATAGVLSAEIDAFDPAWLKDPEGFKRYRDLTKMRDRETGAASDKATKLRLTNQSRYTPQAAATAAKASSVKKKPWEA